MSGDIRNINLKFECKADWGSMPFIDGIKHCGHCRKNVYDFTDAKQSEFLNILAENNNNICGRFNAEQMVAKHSVLPAWKKWLSAAMVLVGINILNNKAEAQAAEKVPTTAGPTKAGEVFHVVLGEPIAMATMPEGNKNLLIRSNYDQQARFPGGVPAYTKFMLKHIRFKQGMTKGKVVLTFNVNTDGSLDGYKILLTLDPLSDEEALNALKSFPKWEPATIKGIPVKSEYTLPVYFDFPQ
jgi:hypothetical protein